MKNVSLPKAVLTVGGLAMVVYHAVASQYLYFSQWEHQTIHFAFLFLMVFMSYAIKAKAVSRPWACIFAWRRPWPAASMCTAISKSWKCPRASPPGRRCWPGSV